MTPTPQEDAREELAKVSSLVLTARRLVAGGALVDLSALEERVEIDLRNRAAHAGGRGAGIAGRAARFDRPPQSIGFRSRRTAGPDAQIGGD